MIPHFSADTSASILSEALEEHGCLVVNNLMHREQRENVRCELQPYMDKARAGEDDPNEFYPGLTRRVSALVASSKTAGDLVLHATSQQICEDLLVPNGEFGYHLHVSAALEVGPGARKQILHREHDTYTFFTDPKPNIIVASMWAVTDFRADNGATLVVPGSHRWPADREAKPDEILSAEMPAGSVLYWLGGTLHGAGANTSQDWRYGIILTYSLGWVRQEENQYLNVPPEIAATLSQELRDMIGYKMHRALGFSNHLKLGSPN